MSSAVEVPSMSELPSVIGRVVGQIELAQDRIKRQI